MSSRAERIRKAKRNITRLVDAGVQMNWSKASAFTLAQAERARRKKFAGRGLGRTSVAADRRGRRGR